MREDLELEPVDSTTINDNYFNYASKTQYKGEDFWIVFEKDEFKDYLGFESYEEFENFLDEIFDYNWGYSDSWQECYNCGKAVYLDDYYTQDYWIDYDGSGLYCGDCVRNNEEVRSAYLDYLANNEDACNSFLSENQLEEAGLEKLEGEYEDGYYGRNDSPHQILNNLMNKYPNGRFVFDLRSHDGYNTVYTVWAFPGYKEGAED